MTSQEVRLCGLLLREHFGEVVEKVGITLLRGGTQNLRSILQETGVSLDLVTPLLVLHVTLVMMQNVSTFYNVCPHEGRGSGRARLEAKPRGRNYVLSLWGSFANQ